jgi:hypothetical protein
MFVQDAVKNIRCDPSRRETWHFGWQCESLRGHFDENISEEAKDSSGDESAVAWGKHLWHANMPNIRIAFMISQFRYDLRPRDLKWTRPHG